MQNEPSNGLKYNREVKFIKNKTILYLDFKSCYMLHTVLRFYSDSVWLWFMSQIACISVGIIVHI